MPKSISKLQTLLKEMPTKAEFDNLPAEEKRLRLLDEFVKVNDEANMTRAEFVRYFEQMVQIIETVKFQSQEELELIRDEVSNTLEEISETVEKELSETEAKTLNEISSKFADLMIDYEHLAEQTQRKLDSVKDGKDADEELIIQSVVSQLPETDDGVAIMKKINKTPKNTKPIKKEKVEGLVELMDKIRRLQRSRFLGGGTSDIGVKATLGRVIFTETPSGDIDGANTEYTVSNTINAVMSFGINGQMIHSDEYTTSGRTITFTTALPAALSGTTFEITYV